MIKPLKTYGNKNIKFRSSLFKGLRVKGRALAVSKGRAFGGIFKGKALKHGKALEHGRG